MAINLTFNDDEEKLGGRVFFNRNAFSEFVYSMHHSEEDALNRHLDQLIETGNYSELSKYPFISLKKPADYEDDPTRYAVEPTGCEHVELREDQENALMHTAVDNAKRHYHLMWLCAHPEEVTKLQVEARMSDVELCSSDPAHAADVREYLVSTIRQVERMKRKYRPDEIAEANRFLDSFRHKSEVSDQPSGELNDLEDFDF